MRVNTQIMHINDLFLQSIPKQDQEISLFSRSGLSHPVSDTKLIEEEEEK